jgi:hypothetical protein
LAVLLKLLPPWNEMKGEDVQETAGALGHS